jgi:uncharacterized protein
MLKKAYKLSLITLFYVFIFTNFSYAVKWQDLEYKNSYVNDYADLLSSEQELELNNLIYEHFASTTNEIAVVIVSDMSGDYIENFAFRLYEKWGIGDEKKDNGVLFLISKNDRKMRIEVGYGLEPILTDGKSRIILDEYVGPEFKNDNYTGGIKIGTEKIIKVLESQGSDLSAAGSASKKISWKIILNFLFSIFPFVFFFGIIFIEWIVSVMGRTKSWWLGGVLGGGIGGLILLFGGLTLIFEIITVILIVLGFVFDYFISKNYKQHKIGDKKGPPDWWSGGTWGPGGNSSNWSSSDSFGGFGDGMSGGGGASSDW